MDDDNPYPRNWRDREATAEELEEAARLKVVRQAETEAADKRARVLINELDKRLGLATAPASVEIDKQWRESRGY